jgi:transglutaminase-like putative cysteine protease
MKLVINHQTHYFYAAAVKRSNQYIRLTPQSFGHQVVHSWQLAAQGVCYSQLDGFGNVWSSLTMAEPHTELLIMAQGVVELHEQVDKVRDDRLSPMIFMHATDTTLCHEPLKAFLADQVKSVDRSGLIHLAGAILEHMPYTPESTSVETTAADAFDLGQGVCQDHTQVFLACARALKLPARYVSGYLYTKDQTHLASHAWAEVYLEGYWYCFDISNQLFSPSQHVQIAIGRDYLDACPVRGVRQGGGQESMRTLVQVLTA